MIPTAGAGDVVGAKRDACPFPGPKSWLCPNDPSRCEHCATWVWESVDAQTLRFAADESVRFVMQTYSGFGTMADGTSWAVRRRRLADGSWFEIRYWSGPPRDRIKTESPKTDP